MDTYIILIRGINVGGKNKVPMEALKECLAKLGFSNISTYIASGNVLITSDKSPGEVQALVEKALPEHFKLDSKLIKVLILTPGQLQAVVENKPDGFGEQPDRYRYDAIFLMGIDAAQIVSLFNPKEGVDKIWAGHGVIYFQRLDALRTKSRLSNIIGTPAYQCMTIRNWNTTTKLLELVKVIEALKDAEY